MTFTLHFRLFLYLVLGFILATIMGTVTHEMGHIAVAKMQGYKTELHYASMNYTGEKHERLEDYYDANKKQILTPNTPEGKEFRKMRDKVEYESFLIGLGGPLQTMITGTLGFFLLWFNRKKIGSKLNFLQWSFVFLAFFWSRQIFNLLSWSINYILSGKPSMRSDEPRISKYLEIPLWSFGLTTAIIAAIALGYITFCLIPKQQRFTFLCAGVAGSAIGFILWMRILGPATLP